MTCIPLKRGFPQLIFILAIASQRFLFGQATTVFEFKRQLDTCDSADNAVPLGAARLVWAYSDQTPTSELDIQEHKDMGQKGARLRNGNSNDTPLPPDATYFDLTFENTTIPFQEQDPDTSYYCKTFKLPILADPTQIVRWEPVIQPENVDVIHHMLTFECSSDLSESEVGWTGYCGDPNAPPAVNECLGATIFSAWAVGGLPYNFPANIGLPMNNHTTKFVILETHYNNQNMRKVVDSSGMRFWRTKQLRQFDAGILETGSPTDPNFVIPAHTAAKTFTSYCPANCTSLMLPPAGIIIVGTILHAHLSGVDLSLRHVRNGVELPLIADEPHYDFNFQDFDDVIPPRVVLPGDMLITSCTYSTLDRKYDTTFGLGTHNEMCLAFSVYYPRAPLIPCLSANYTGINDLNPNITHGGDISQVVFCEPGVGLTADQIDLRVTHPYMPNCTRVVPNSLRTTPQPLTNFNASFYQNHMWMDEAEEMYQLYWNVDFELSELQVAVEVNIDQGWVGFGISETGGMIGSDVSIGWLGADGVVHHRDRFAYEHALPPQDTLQDYYDVRGGLVPVSGGGGRQVMTTARIVGLAIACGLLLVAALVCLCRRIQSNKHSRLTSDLVSSLNATGSSNDRRRVKTSGGHGGSSKPGKASKGGGYYVAVQSEADDRDLEHEQQQQRRSHDQRRSQQQQQEQQRQQQQQQPRQQSAHSQSRQQEYEENQIAQQQQPADDYSQQQTEDEEPRDVYSRPNPRARQQQQQQQVDRDREPRAQQDLGLNIDRPQVSEEYEDEYTEEQEEDAPDREDA